MKSNPTPPMDELRKIVEDSVRHVRANVGFTLNSHEAAEQNISMNVETIMAATYRYAQRMVVEELKQAREMIPMYQPSPVEQIQGKTAYNEYIKCRITTIEKGLDHEKDTNTI